MGGVEVGIKNLSKSFGSSNIWSDVTLTLPAGEVSVLLGPSGTGKSVLLKSIIGLLKPEKGSIFIHDTDLVRCSESKLYEIPQVVRGAVPGRCAVRVDEHLRQHRVPAA